MQKQSRKVEVIAYSPEWKDKFKLAARKMKEIFGDQLLDVHHIGSTSVPGLSAKPVIDLLLVVKDIANIDQFNSVMKGNSFEPKGENGIPGRRYFQKGGNNRTHHVHVYQVGNPEIERHLNFRDYMITHPEAANLYGELKESLALKFPEDIESYINGKNDFVKEMDKKVAQWLPINLGEVN